MVDLIWSKEASKAPEWLKWIVRVEAQYMLDQDQAPLDDVARVDSIVCDADRLVVNMAVRTMPVSDNVFITLRAI